MQRYVALSASVYEASATQDAPDQDFMKTKKGTVFWLALDYVGEWLPDQNMATIRPYNAPIAMNLVSLESWGRELFNDTHTVSTIRPYKIKTWSRIGFILRDWLEIVAFQRHQSRPNRGKISPIRGDVLISKSVIGSNLPIGFRNLVMELGA